MSRTQPALLCLGLSNGHFMVAKLNCSDHRTLPALNHYYSHFMDALALLQKGNLDYIAGRGVVALHRDWGEPWHEHQPRFYPSRSEVSRYAKSQLSTRLFLFESPRASQWSEEFLEKSLQPLS